MLYCYIMTILLLSRSLNVRPVTTFLFSIETSARVNHKILMSLISN